MRNPRLMRVLLMLGSVGAALASAELIGPK
jgi:hypothetical protein